MAGLPALSCLSEKVMRPSRFLFMGKKSMKAPQGRRRAVPAVLWQAGRLGSNEHKAFIPLSHEIPEIFSPPPTSS